MKKLVSICFQRSCEYVQPGGHEEQTHNDETEICADMDNSKLNPLKMQSVLRLASGKGPCTPLDVIVR